MIREYRIKWNYCNKKLTNFDRYVGSDIYKELVVNNQQFIIIKYILRNKRIRYKCKKWNGVKWYTFAITRNPRQALNRIKKEANYNQEDYLLYA